MRFVLGFYTQLSQNAPDPVPLRALTCILKPLLTYIHNNRDCRLSIAPGSAMINYLSWHFPEINLLIASLAKNGSLEPVTSSYNNTILSLIPHKDRSASVDKTTTLIRKIYGVRATSLWCYGQIWDVSVIAMMKTIGLERLVISSYNALSQKSSALTSCSMNEIGRKIDVIQASDRLSRLVSSYGQNEITLGELKSSMCEYIASYSGEELVCMVNIDQLCQGASYNREDDETLYTVFTSMFETARERGASFSLLRDMSPSSVGYLPSGWYGRDACASGLSSFNEMFCRNESYRFYLGRYMALSQLVDEARKDRVLRRRLQEKLSALPSGNLFLCDTHASCLSLCEHRQYYRTLIEVESTLLENGMKLTRADIDDDGQDEEFCYGKLGSAVFSLTGASCYEYCLKEPAVNIFDTVPSWIKSFPDQLRRRSFCDSYIINGRSYDFSRCPYTLESVNKARTDFFFSYTEEDLPFAVSKHYRLTNQNLYMSHTIVNNSDELLEGEYVTTVCFTLPGASAFAYDARKGPLVGASLSDIKTVRFYDSSRRMQLSFTSNDSFSVEEDNRYQSEVTTLGSEQFYLYTEVKLHFRLSVAGRSAQSLNIVTRLTREKEK